MIFSVYRLKEAKGNHLTKKVAVIGIGSVGLGIAQTLLRAGFETIGCDLNQQILRDFETAGGVSVPSPGDIDADCDGVAYNLDPGNVAKVYESISNIALPQPKVTD